MPFVYSTKKVKSEKSMAASPLLRGFPLLRLRLQQHRLASGLLLTLQRPICTSTPAADSTTWTEEDLSTAKGAAEFLRVKKTPRFNRVDDTEYRKWKDEEAEILSDIEPLSLFAKDILHSDRYLDGQQLTVEDEGIVVEKFLAYHPHAEDKIGCGVGSIMVDRHPQFRQSRCLFVVRTDGLWIDFSYQKCLREYIRSKYPSHAERFIKEHFKRGSG